MAKKTHTLKSSDKRFKILAGLLLLLVAVIGLDKILTIILVLLGGYLIYEGLRNH